jgi:hypothetical protein
MTMDHDVTRDLRAWLQTERGEEADRVVNDVLDQIEWIDQRRPSWVARRFQSMNDNRFRFGIAAAAIVAVAFLGVRLLPASVGGPGPEEVPETTFTSERHQYALLFPDDAWRIVERPGEWAPGTVFEEWSPGLDVADKLGESEAYVLLASQPLDLERDEWLARYDRLAAEAFPHCPLESTETRTVDGEEARISFHACDGVGDGVEAIMFHGDRVFALRVFGVDERYDPRPHFEEFLDAFRFLD